MTCARETDMAALEAALTTDLAASYGTACIATRNLSFDPQGLMPEETPRLSLWEQGRVAQQADEFHVFRTLTLWIIGTVKAVTTNSAIIQSQLNELESWLDHTLSGYQNLGGITVGILPTGQSLCSAGDQEGVLQYEVRIDYAEEAAQ